MRSAFICYLMVTGVFAYGSGSGMPSISARRTLDEEPVQDRDASVSRRSRKGGPSSGTAVASICRCRYVDGRTYTSCSALGKAANGCGLMGHIARMRYLGKTSPACAAVPQ